MPVHIERIAVENLGPLNSCEMALARFNLIYGRNETGKTYLVEFLLKSLFRNAAEWALRDVPGQGIVTVGGLADGPVDFRPGSDKKLEDFWEAAETGLPANMARLLVVKGGDLAMDAESPSGVGRDVLKTALSRERLLEKILSPILKTTQEARIENGTIQGQQRGEIKRRQELLDDRRRLDNLFEEIEARYSQGPLRSLELQARKLNEDLEAQRDAKRHQAYLLRERREEWRAERALVPDEPLQELQATLRDYQGEIGELARLEEELETKQRASKGYPWVAQAIGIWEGRSLEEGGPPALWLLVAAGLSLIAGLAGSLLDQAFMGILAFAFGMGLGAYFIFRVTRPGASGADVEERQAIRDGYEERFGERLGGLAGLRARHEELREAQADARHAQERVDESRQRREELAAAVARQLHSLTDEQVSEEQWASTVERLRRQARELDEEIHQVELRLSELGVEEADYRADPAPVEFDARTLRELEAAHAELGERLRAAQQDLDGLKQEVCRETENNITDPWPEVLANLRARRQQVEAEYRQITGEILGKIGVSQVLEGIRAQEDEKIREGLKAPEVVDVLKKVTGAYESLDLAEEGVLVAGARGEYMLRELSTGAREQVLLALRLGFAARLAGGEPLFLLLDDAFQHSDWLRREHLVESVTRLAEEGWQVTYLTMDDHIRDLCCEVGQAEFADDFNFTSID